MKAIDEIYKVISELEAESLDYKTRADEIEVVVRHYRGLIDRLNGVGGTGIQANDNRPGVSGAAVADLNPFDKGSIPYMAFEVIKKNGHPMSTKEINNALKLSASNRKGLGVRLSQKKNGFYTLKKQSGVYGLVGWENSFTWDEKHKKAVRKS